MGIFFKRKDYIDVKEKDVTTYKSPKQILNDIDRLSNNSRKSKEELLLNYMKNHDIDY